MVVASDSARSSWESAIVTDRQGGIHIAYATGSSQAVYHIASTDGGKTWSAPTRLSAPFDALETSISNVRLATDGAGRLHIVWQTNQKQGYGQAVYYARSVDSGKSWSAPVRMGYRDPGEFEVSLPAMVAVGDSELHLAYTDGAWHTGRYHRISHDGGATWSEPVQVFLDFEGINGFPILLVDGAQELWWVQTWRTRDQLLGGTFYAHWLGTSWSPMELAVSDGPLWPADHYTAATVSLGNELIVLWASTHSGEIWAIRGMLPGVAPLPTATMPGLVTATTSVPITVTQTSPSVALTARPTSAYPDPVAPASGELADNPLLYSIGVPALVVLIVVGGALLVLLRRNR